MFQEITRKLENIQRDFRENNMQTGKIKVKKEGNESQVKIALASQFKYADTVYYQVGEHGDYVQSNA